MRGGQVAGGICPLCTAELVGSIEAREMMLGLRERFHYGECSGCSSLVLLDVPDRLERFYPPDYYSLRPRRRRHIVRLARRMRAEAAAHGYSRVSSWLGLGAGPPPWAEWLRIAGLDRSAAICDVGSGAGDQLFGMRDEGFTSLTGVDPFIERRFESSSLRILKGTLGQLSGRFDLIMFNHSFEHLAAPLAALRAARARLRPGGTVMIRTPVAGCWAWQHFGADWVGLDPPRHLFVPSLDGIHMAAGEADLVAYEVAFDSTDMQFWRSEQYQRDISLFDPASHQVDPRGSPYSGAQIRGFRRDAERLNEAGEGDTVAVFLKPIDADGGWTL